MSCSLNDSSFIQIFQIPKLRIFQIAVRSLALKELESKQKTSTKQLSRRVEPG